MANVSYYTRLALAMIMLAGPASLIIEISAQSLEPSALAGEAPFGQQVVVVMESYSYTPSEVVVEKGKPVTLTLTNQSFLVPHNFLLDDPSGHRLIDTDISSGDSQAVTLTLDEPGTYPFYCDKQLLFFPSHRQQGMEGRLIVR